MPAPERAGRAATGWAVAALVWTLVIGTAWLVAPTGRSTSTSVSSDGTSVTESSTHTLLESEGPSVVVLLAVPVVLAGLSVLARGSRRARFACGGALLFACLLAAASIGLPYLPAAVALMAAAALTPDGPRAQRGR